MGNQDRQRQPNFIRATQSHWLTNVGAAAGDLRKLQAEWVEAAIPEELMDFLRWSNGARCIFAHAYLDIWSIASIIELNGSYRIRRYLGDSCMGIGTDGGSTLIALDLGRQRPGHVISFDLGDLDHSRAKSLAESIGDLFCRLDSGLLASDSLYP